MKLKYNFIISEIAGQKVAVPIDCGNGEQSIIKINDTGAYILEKLKTNTSKEEIIESIKYDFNIDNEENIENWVANFIQKLKEAEVLADD